MKRFDPKAISNPDLFNTLQRIVGPRPIAFASTIDTDGKPNLSPFSFFNVFGSNPPTVVFSPSRRGRDNTTKHTYENVKQVPEVVINVVSYSMVQQVNLASAEYPKGVNEFEKAGFTAIASEMVRPMRVKESPAQIECKVVNVIETGDKGGAGNLVICEVLLIHINPDVFDEKGRVVPDKIDLVARMGDNYYCRASGDAIFELPKPEGLGIGFEALPEKAKNSKVLTGNDLGKLAHLNRFPDKLTIEGVRQQAHIQRLLVEHSRRPAALREVLHNYAKQLIEKGKLQEALCVLIVAEK